MAVGRSNIPLHPLTHPHLPKSIGTRLHQRSGLFAISSAPHQIQRTFWDEPECASGMPTWSVAVSEIPALTGTRLRTFEWALLTNPNRSATRRPHRNNCDQDLHPHPMSPHIPWTPDITDTNTCATQGALQQRQRSPQPQPHPTTPPAPEAETTGGRSACTQCHAAQQNNSAGVRGCGFALPHDATGTALPLSHDVIGGHCGKRQHQTTTAACAQHKAGKGVRHCSGQRWCLRTTSPLTEMRNGHTTRKPKRGDFWATIPQQSSTAHTWRQGREGSGTHSALKAAIPAPTAAIHCRMVPGRYLGIRYQRPSAIGTKNKTFGAQFLPHRRCARGWVVCPQSTPCRVRSHGQNPQHPQRSICSVFVLCLQ